MEYHHCFPPLKSGWGKYPMTLLRRESLNCVRRLRRSNERLMVNPHFPSSARYFAEWALKSGRWLENWRRSSVRNTNWKKRWGIFLPLALVLVLASIGASGEALAGPGDGGGGALPPIQADVLCTYAIDPVSATHTSLAEDGVVTVTAPAGCDWTVDNLNDWVQIHFFTNGTGNGSVRYTVFANPNPYPRSCVLTIGGEIFTIDQLAGPCAFSILPAKFKPFIIL